MSQKGVTLLELMIAVALIPLLGLTAVQLDFLIQNYFNRATRSMVPEQEVELALSAMAKDVVTARTLTVYDGDWLTVVPDDSPGPGDRMELVVDDDNGIPNGHTPEDETDDDRIRYWMNGTTIERLYAVDAGGFDGGQEIATHIQSLGLVQPTGEALQPQNVIRATVTATLGQATVQRTRYMASRALPAFPP